MIFNHPVAEIVVVLGLDDIGDFRLLGPFRRAEAMPAIDDFVVLIDLNRGQRVEDVSVLRDQIVALAEPGSRSSRSTTSSRAIICGESIPRLSHDRGAA